MTAEQADGWTLVAAAVTLARLEDEFEHVGWSEDGGDGDHLIVMRGPDDDDYCLVTAAGTTYGGVTDYSAQPGRTVLTLSMAAAEDLDLQPTVVLEYDPEGVDSAAFCTALEHVLKF